MGIISAYLMFLVLMSLLYFLVGAMQDINGREVVRGLFYITLAVITLVAIWL